MTGCDSFVSTQGLVYTRDGRYKEDLKTWHSCDSIVRYQVTIASPKTTNERQKVCDSTFIDGSWYYKSQDVVLNKTTFQGCDSTHTIQLDIISGNPGVTQNGDTLTSDQIGASYTWINCGSGKFAGTTRRIIPKEDGDYKVVILLNGCRDTSECYTVSRLGLKAIQIEGFKLYPNPSKGAINVEWSEKTRIDKYVVVNALGKVVSNDNTISGSNVTIEESVLPGVYHLLLYSEGTIYTTNFIVQ